MVVVAIIAILSTIAIPSYQTFQAKARQKEGFALLGGYFQAAQASRTEYTFFPGDFVGTGFSPVGSLGYRLETADNAAALPFGQQQDPACIITSSACNAVVANFKEWLECGDPGTTCTAGVLAAPNNTIGPIAGTCAGPLGACVANTNSFVANASAIISTKAAAIDEYQINESKALTMVTDGTK